MTIKDLFTPKCGETWIYKKYKQMKEKTVVTLLMEELDTEMKMGTKMVVNWDRYLEMEKEQLENARPQIISNCVIMEISDEEIEKIAKEYVLYNESKRNWVVEGMKLYREQLKKKEL